MGWNRNVKLYFLNILEDRRVRVIEVTWVVYFGELDWWVHLAFELRKGGEQDYLERWFPQEFIKQPWELFMQMSQLKAKRVK